MFLCIIFIYLFLPLSGKHWHITARKTISRLELVEFICFLRVLQSPPHNPKASILVSFVFSLTFLLLPLSQTDATEGSAAYLIWQMPF